MGGKVTLETYILQFHVWMRTTGLNGSPKYLLVWVPGDSTAIYFINLALMTAVYIFISVRLSSITMVLRDAVCPESLRGMAIKWVCLAAGMLICWVMSYAFVGELAFLQNL